MKIYIQGMTLKKEKLLKRMDSYSTEIAFHLAKCVMYGDSLGNGKYDHWISEISNWISSVNECICKHNNKKLKAHQYQNSLFADLGDSLTEAKMNLQDVQISCKKSVNRYPYRELDKEMIDTMYIVSMEIMHTFSNLLATMNDTTQSDIDKMLHDILDDRCKNR